MMLNLYSWVNYECLNHFFYNGKRWDPRGNVGASCKIIETWGSHPKLRVDRWDREQIAGRRSQASLSIAGLPPNPVCRKTVMPSPSQESTAYDGIPLIEALFIKIGGWHLNWGMRTSEPGKEATRLRINEINVKDTNKLLQEKYFFFGTANGFALAFLLVIVSKCLFFSWCRTQVFDVKNQVAILVWKI